MFQFCSFMELMKLEKKKKKVDKKKTNKNCIKKNTYIDKLKK